MCPSPQAQVDGPRLRPEPLRWSAHEAPRPGSGCRHSPAKHREMAARSLPVLPKKSEIRNTKSETISNDPNANVQNQMTFSFWILTFENLNLFRASDFGFRVSVYFIVPFLAGSTIRRTASERAWRSYLGAPAPSA